MRNVAARDAFRGPEIKLLDAMRDLVVSPAMGVCTLEPGVVWTQEKLRRERIAPPFMETTAPSHRGLVAALA